MSSSNINPFLFLVFYAEFFINTVLCVNFSVNCCTVLKDALKKSFTTCHCQLIFGNTVDIYLAIEVIICYSSSVRKKHRKVKITM